MTRKLVSFAVATIALVNVWRAQNRLGPISATQFDSNRYDSLDARISKAIQLGDRRKLEFIAQVFNVFGTDNLLPPGAGSYVDNALSDSFGKILSAQPRQQGEIAIRYSFWPSITRSANLYGLRYDRDP